MNFLTVLTAFVSFELIRGDAVGDWGYKGANGPEHLKDMANSYGGGSRRAPININIDKETVTFAEDQKSVVTQGVSTSQNINLTVTATSLGGDWGYKGANGSEYWMDISHSYCGVSRQSINIKKRTVTFTEDLKSAVTKGVSTSQNINLTVTATSLKLDFSDSWNITFEGKGCYRPVGIHWYWGSKDGQGSEDRIDDKKYALEGHIVTYNCSLYSNFLDAIKGENSIYVFGILYSVGEKNPALEKVLINIKEPTKGSMLIPEIAPAEFMPHNVSAYFRYIGSLTTPPCDEIVVWTLFNDIQFVSQEQLSKFRSLLFGNKIGGLMEDNFRSVQNLNHRPTYSSFIIPKQSNIYAPQTITVAITSIAVISYTFLNI